MPPPLPCRITNMGTDPVFLDQVVLQYWFHGPLDGTTDAAGNSTASSEGVTSDVVAQVSASQFRLTCSDATPELGECPHACCSHVGEVAQLPLQPVAGLLQGSAPTGSIKVFRVPAP